MWDFIISCCRMQPAARPTASQGLEILRSRQDVRVDEHISSDWDKGFIAQLRLLAKHPDLSGANVWE